MSMKDKELGMDRAITRRDFLNGASVAIGGGVRGKGEAVSESATGSKGGGIAQPGEYYPPRLTGLRGSHDGSFEVAHEMRYGKTWDEAESTGESYDLIVAGGGLSGLSAAYYFRKALPEARILILDNHDDFGGHAKRNEFVVDGRLVIGYGGTMMIHGANSYPYEAKALLEDIGIDKERFLRTTASDGGIYRRMGLRSAVFFDEQTFGSDYLAVGVPEGGGDQPGWAEFLAPTPLSDAVKRDLASLYEDTVDYLPGATDSEKIDRLRKMSYSDYLLQVVKADPGVIAFLNRRADPGNGHAGIDSWSAWGAFRCGQLPGFAGLGLERPPMSWLGPGDDFGPGIHFPDGNAGVARLLVRWLIPSALPGSSMEDSVATPVDYGALDKDGSPVRVRLNSTVVNARHVGERHAANEVEVTYVRQGKAYKARGATCIMACYNSMIPYLCPDLPAQQKDALKLAVRQPWVYSSVVVRNWRAFRDLGIRSIYSPGGYHFSTSLDMNRSLGDYTCARTPDDPQPLHLERMAADAPGLPARDQFRAGREELQSTSFEYFEYRIRDELGRALAGGGFDPAGDIAAITVNRWPHGYAGGSNDLYDPEWGYDEVPWVVGRQRHGRIAIANSDAAATSLTHAAMDQAHRAVQELLTDVVRPEFQYPWAERT